MSKVESADSILQIAESLAQQLSETAVVTWIVKVVFLKYSEISFVQVGC